MTRTIKFRGKSLDNSEWVYGDLEHNPGNKITRIHSYNSEGNYQGQNIVVPDTVCQFTELLDRNVKEIYEGDIMEYKNSIGVVTYYNGRGQFQLKVKGQPPIALHNLKGVILGNIYDNPDLLK